MENNTNSIMNILKELVEKKGLIDVGSGAEIGLHVQRSVLNDALKQLKETGEYDTYTLFINHIDDSKTVFNVLGKAGKSAKELYMRRSKIAPATDKFDASFSRTLLKSMDLINRYTEYVKQGLSEKEIAEKMGYFKVDKDGNKTTEPSASLLKGSINMARNNLRRVRKLAELKKNFGETVTQIADEFGVSDAVVRGLIYDN